MSHKPGDENCQCSSLWCVLNKPILKAIYAEQEKKLLDILNKLRIIRRKRNPMQITKRYDYYLDGGSIRISTDDGTFYIDRRCNTKTLDEVYDGYPDNGKIVKDSAVIDKIIAAVKDDLTDEDAPEVLRILRKEPTVSRRKT